MGMFFCACVAVDLLIIVLVVWWYVVTLCVPKFRGNVCSVLC